MTVCVAPGEWLAWIAGEEVGSGALEPHVGVQQAVALQGGAQLGEAGRPLFGGGEAERVCATCHRPHAVQGDADEGGIPRLQLVPTGIKKHR